MNVIYIDLTKLDATIVCFPRTPTYLRHLADGRVLKYPIERTTPASHTPSPQPSCTALLTARLFLMPGLNLCPDLIVSLYLIYYEHHMKSHHPSKD